MYESTWTLEVRKSAGDLTGKTGQRDSVFPSNQIALHDLQRSTFLNYSTMNLSLYIIERLQLSPHVTSEIKIIEHTMTNTSASNEAQVSHSVILPIVMMAEKGYPPLFYFPFLLSDGSAQHTVVSKINCVSK